MLTHRINTICFFATAILLAVLAFTDVLSWWWLLATPFIWLGIAVAGSGLIRSGYHIKALYRKKHPTVKEVAITFDDGPTPETEKVLELLAKYNAKATFFCIGTQIEQYPEIVNKTVAAGHTIGNHTYSHSKQLSIFPVEKTVNELLETDALINESTQRRPLLFRPPFGVTSPNIAKALKLTGHYVIGWNVRSLDAVIDSEVKIFNRIKGRLAPGCIILLHDTSQKTVNVLEQLLLLLQQEGYKAVTVDRLLDIPAYEK
ncbi:polysaccharide deacetylase family protein [Flavobacterium sp. Sd200]|uniref:polysaccharide deacetylase family protein n=1 Tax=Flavobacterium sp. Sd200 TaxID=2692211 RepID=UPI00136F7CFC|nr:polysaccharide deacetylase family protein [Flavobacterium sp. Sd200]MXN90012.1 polysaccharide deacetylase family protein [Flavobacterium sp. Sd200]